MGATEVDRPRVGVYINNRAAVFGGDEFGIDDMMTLAVAAEERGFDFVSVGDSVLAKPRWSPVVTLAAVAAATSTIGLATGVIQPHLRHPVLLAQEWLTLDAISGGRATLVVGLGTGPPELVDKELGLVGLTRANRARAFEESIEVIKKLWNGGPVDHEGPIYRLDGVDIGLESGGDPPPLLIAAGAYIPAREGFGPNDVFDPSIADSFIGPWRRVARLGDGWMTGMATPEEIRLAVAAIEHEAEEMGRSLPVGFDRRLNVFVLVSDRAAGARAEGQAFLEAYHRRPMDEASLDRWLVCGPPNACTERLTEYIDAGITSFQCVLASVDQRRQLDSLAADVVPQLFCEQ
jgi:alkanesulfonate monooxygenase SsuD/methylene tetrahydromethanopterin reductase-like flavin-dependent oxidoreductase (luciferase family)